ncbi:MAG: NAD(P)H-hydrate dehydratase [Hydrogenophaga sp.]|uniref:NAD(P)H-hydrate dehydratase n=1 Tax=Hydrogenophaga sp. TaxID=1904254 RepID=UPI0025810101|nr:NAD(P)H-hydrate dehydratase [Hydrogenophaga sp.]MBL0944314.1 NAD(P)H-hydrate dehydratase [Hydrogenophaga sp.]
MRRVVPTHLEALHGAAATRAIEQALAARQPPHALMARAGLAVARLATALAPHARRIWIACGPGNNGGDGLIAATHLQAWARTSGCELVLTLDADPGRQPPDAAWALEQVRAAGLPIASDAPADADLVIDALLGLGARPVADGPLAARLAAVRQQTAPVLAVDLPSGLNADTGDIPEPGPVRGPRHTLSLLTLKPGLFTAHGRDLAGEVWFDDLGAGDASDQATAWWGGFEDGPDTRIGDAHAGHKGRYGDVGVLGGQLPGEAGVAMGGAAVLAATAALHAGAGRVLVALVGDGPVPALNVVQPELMFRSPLRLLDALNEDGLTVVAGCGGGDAIRAVLPRCLHGARRLVLDADALNAVATDTVLQGFVNARSHRGWVTVLTPHPLEAARLLGTTTAAVMADRLGHAQALSQRHHAVVALKGSGTVVAAPGQLPWINACGNARLASAGTGDVLAGLIGAALARNDRDPYSATCAAVAHHGALADHWPAHRALTAQALAQAARPF